MLNGTFGIQLAESKMWGVTANRYGIYFGDGENVLKLTVVMAVQLCEYNLQKH